MKRSFFLAATAAVVVAPSLPKQVVTVMKPQADFGFQNLTFNGGPVLIDAEAPGSYYGAKTFYRLYVDRSKDFTFEEWRAKG